ncbi:MAG: nucleoside-triphosphatase [Coriobacteriales bacterium]
MNIYVITGAIQTGKTTWVARMLEQAAQRGLQVSGVLAPAVFEDGVKTGIDALLLPSGERFGLARKNAAFAQLHAQQSQGQAASRADGDAAAQRVRLAWDMSDDALARVNAHFSQLRSTGFGQLMVVDEFGPLEFSGGQGYIEGMAVMDEGLPANALLVLRPALLDTARQRWGAFELLDVDSPVGPFLKKIAH